MNSKKIKSPCSIARFLEFLGGIQFIPYPLKLFSSSFIGVGIWGAIIIHVIAVLIIQGYDWVSFEPTVEVVIVPYPSQTINMVDSKSMTALKLSRGTHQRSLADPTENKSKDVQPKESSLVFQIPKPLEEILIVEIHQTSVQVNKKPKNDLGEGTNTTIKKEVGLRGVVGSGNSAKGQMTNTIDNSNKSGGWIYDTKPKPSRINMTISKEEIPNKLKHLKDIRVRFRLLINEYGKVINASMIKSTGYIEIDKILLEKIYASQYHPATLRKEPIRAWIDVGYGYKIGG